MDLNKQIAEIGGWKNIRLVSYGRHGDYPKVLMGQSPEGYRKVPDYLAPENLHELVRVADEKFVYYEIYKYTDGYYWVKFRLLGSLDQSLNHSKGPATNISIALAEAIIEAKG